MGNGQDFWINVLEKIGEICEAFKFPSSWDNGFNSLQKQAFLALGYVIAPAI